MAQYTVFLVKHNDGHTQSFVGNPQKTYDNAREEMNRLLIEEDYDIMTLEIVEVPA